MRASSFAVVLACVVGPVACTEDTAPPEAASPMVVLDAGAAPLIAFAHVAPVGARYVLELTQSSSMALFADGKTVPETAIPALELKLGLELQERTRETMRLRFAVTDAQLDATTQGDPNTRQVLEKELKAGAILGLGGTLTSEHGGMKRQTTSNLTGPSSSILRNVLNQLRQSLDQCVVPLPRDPIGIGAKWTTTRAFDFSGIEMSEIATWRLTARTDAVWTVHAEFEYSALGSAVKLPGMPDDAKLTLRELRGTGRGDFELDPALALPRIATCTATLDLKADAPVKEKVEPIDATITTRSRARTSTP